MVHERADTSSVRLLVDAVRVFVEASVCKVHARADKTRESACRGRESVGAVDLIADTVRECLTFRGRENEYRDRESVCKFHEMENTSRKSACRLAVRVLRP